MLNLCVIRNEAGQYFGGLSPPSYRPIWVGADSVIVTLSSRDDDEVATNHRAAVIRLQEAPCEPAQLADPSVGACEPS